jgi:hypothetical protein
VRPARKRSLVDEVQQAWNVSIRKACDALRVDRSLYHYKGNRDPFPEEDKDILIAYHQKLPMPGSPEFQRAEQLDDDMRKRRRLAAQTASSQDT